jgi:4-hydroxy-tetrahydrodipicolinate reductase
MGYWVSLLAKENPKKFKLTYTPLKNEPLDGFYDCDVVIDFSSADAVCNFIKNSETKTNRGKSQPALVIGSTGWSPEQNKLLKKYSTRTAVAVSSNFSIGVLVLREVLKSAGPLLKNLGYTPVMLERHHEHKKDAPSGTAIMLNQVIGEISNSRIQTHSVRSKEIIGDHQITFYGSADYLQFEPCSRSKHLCSWSS